MNGFTKEEAKVYKEGLDQLFEATNHIVLTTNDLFRIISWYEVYEKSMSTQMANEQLLKDKELKERIEQEITNRLSKIR